MQGHSCRGACYYITGARAVPDGGDALPARAADLALLFFFFATTARARKTAKPCCSRCSRRPRAGARSELHPALAPPEPEAFLGVDWSRWDRRGALREATSLRCMLTGVFLAFWG